MTNIMFFFGAGASAPFGIPTMQEMVTDFAQTLNRPEKSEERQLHEDIHHFLESNLGRPVDLESIFTIVDSIVEWSPEKMGLSAAYHLMKSLKATRTHGMESAKMERIPAPSENEVSVANSLRSDFEAYIQDVCQIQANVKSNIDEVYQDFFAQVGSKVGGAQGGSSGRYVMGNWPMFTTNYDSILESYWTGTVKTELNTGFSYDTVAKMSRLNPDLLRDERSLRLYKLHGSITWLQDEYWGLTEHQSPPHEMRTYLGGRFSGRVMLYPIEEKALHVEPYQTLFQRLNRELDISVFWLVLGYSFGDRIIRDIFVRNSHRGKTRLILVHPHASEIASSRLGGFEGSIRTLDIRFGLIDFRQINAAIAQACGSS